MAPRPVRLLGVYMLLVIFVLDRPGVAPGLSLACAIVPFQVVMMTVSNSLTAVQLRGSVILNMSFDRMLIPVSAALTETVAFGASLVLLALMMANYGIAPTIAIVWLPVAIAVTILFAVACAYVGSLVGLWFRDLRPFAISFVRAMYFVAPGLVALDQIPGRMQTLVKANPLSGIFESYRSILLEGHRPEAWELLYPLAAAVVILLVAIPVYRREQEQFAKVLG